MTKFRILDLHLETVSPSDIIIESHSLEAEAHAAFGLELVRSGAKRDLRTQGYLRC